jgi:phospholipid/cholesterol/gamma-HCH transport system substrate-binding protein
MSGIGGIRDSLQGLIGEMRHGDGVIGKAVSDKNLAAQLDSSLYRLAQLNDELTGISKIARAGALGFAENMEALKHNWLFKGYFERLGFWNRAEFEKYYSQRKHELNEYEKRQAQSLQVQQIQKLLNQRKQQVEKLEQERQPENP